MNKLISYYELLGMIKEGNIPERILNLGSTYFWDGERYKTESGIYLSDMDETEMFDKCIEIPNDDFEDIEKIDLGILNNQSEKNREFKNRINQLINNQKKIINILKSK